MPSISVRFEETTALGEWPIALGTLRLITMFQEKR